MTTSFGLNDYIVNNNNVSQAFKDAYTLGAYPNFDGDRFDHQRGLANVIIEIYEVDPDEYQQSCITYLDLCTDAEIEFLNECERLIHAENY